MKLNLMTRELEHRALEFLGIIKKGDKMIDKFCKNYTVSFTPASVYQVVVQLEGSNQREIFYIPETISKEQLLTDMKEYLQTRTQMMVDQAMERFSKYPKEQTK